MGVGDEVPAAIEQLGAQVEMLAAEDLAWGDLSRFTTIVTGVRAYERRADLRANNSRLLDYVRNGGTADRPVQQVRVQRGAVRPVPRKVSSDRVTDEPRRSTILDAGRSAVHHARTRSPTRPGRAGCRSAGLYFLGERDPRYRDLVELEDPFPNNTGRSAARSSKRSTARDAGSTSASACGASCRPASTARTSCSPI